MKRIMLLVVLTALTLTLQAQPSFDNLFYKYAREAHSESVRVGPLMMRLARLCSDDCEDARILSHIHEIRVVSLEECASRVKDQFREEAKQLTLGKNIEMLMEVSDDEDQMQIFVERDGNRIKEFVLVNVGADPCLVRMKGSILESEIERLINEGNVVIN